MPPTDQLITTAQACARLGIERTTLTRWVSAGRVKPAFRPPTRNGAFLFQPADIDRLVAARDRETTQAAARASA